MDRAPWTTSGGCRHRPLRDPAQTSSVSARRLPGRQAQVAGEPSAGAESGEVADEADERSGGEQAHTGYGAQPSGEGIGPSDSFELSLDHREAFLELSELARGFVEDRTHGFGHAGVYVAEVGVDLRDDFARADGDEETEFPEQAAQRVEPCRSRGLPGRAQTVKAGAGMLIERLDGHGTNFVVAYGFEPGLGICGIRVVAHASGTLRCRVSREGESISSLQADADQPRVTEGAIVLARQLRGSARAGGLLDAAEF